MHSEDSLSAIRKELTSFQQQVSQKLTDLEQRLENLGKTEAKPTKPVPTDAALPDPLKIDPLQVNPLKPDDERSDDRGKDTAITHPSAATTPSELPASSSQSTDSQPATYEEAPILDEGQIGKVWLVRGGVVFLLMGLIFLGNYAYQNWIRELSAGLRLTGLSSLAISMVILGQIVAKRSKEKSAKGSKETRSGMAQWGQTLSACGLGFAYWLSYAASQVSNLKVIDSPVLALLVQAGAGLSLIGIAWWRRSELIASGGILLTTLALLIQYHTETLAPSLLILATISSACAIVHQWSSTRFAGTMSVLLLLCIDHLLYPATNSATTLWHIGLLWMILSLPDLRIWSKLRAQAPQTPSSTAIALSRFCAATLSTVCLALALYIQPNWETQGWSASAALTLGLIAMSLSCRLPLRACYIGLALTTFTTTLLLGLEGYTQSSALALQTLTLAVWAKRSQLRSLRATARILGLLSFLSLLFARFLFDLYREDDTIYFAATLSASLLLAATAVLQLAHSKTRLCGWNFPLILYAYLALCLGLYHFFSVQTWSVILASLALLILSPPVLQKPHRLSSIGITLAIMALFHVVALTTHFHDHSSYITTTLSFILALSILSLLWHLRTGQNRIMLYTSALLAGFFSIHLIQYNALWDYAVAFLTLYASCMIGLGLYFRQQDIRLVGLWSFGLAVLRVLCIDIWQFKGFERILAFLALGATMVIAGYFYNKVTNKLSHSEENKPS